MISAIWGWFLAQLWRAAELAMAIFVCSVAVTLLLLAVCALIVIIGNLRPGNKKKDGNADNIYVLGVTSKRRKNDN
ncbi:MAG: hypothetical protein KIH63_004640 [Candidatus Saccharibacteria bacterium]|nr:hypothetical protein [Candidatus Saccharibacteria bacterium]